MHTKKLVSAGLGLLAATALAQAVLGSVISVNGVATITTGTSGTVITRGTPILEGSRIISTRAGVVIFRLATGCTVHVPPGHGVTVRSNLSCRQLEASVEPVTLAVTTTTPGTVQAGAGSGATRGAAIAAFTALLAIGVISSNNDDSGSPSQPVVTPTP